MPKPDDAWFQSIKWSKACLECIKMHGMCPMSNCAEANYDENGDEIQVEYDGDYQQLE